MKDDEYFGFSSNGDFKVINPPDSVDDFTIIDLVDFSNENDIRIVSLDDVHHYRKNAHKEDEGHSWVDDFDPVKREAAMLPSASALRPRSSHRRRVVKSLIVSGLVMLGMIVFLSNGLWLSRGSTAHPSSAASTASQPVTMAPAIAPPANAAPFIIDTTHFYIQFSTSWRQVLLDGQPLLHVPIPGVDSPLWIAPGHHLVMWQTGDHQMYSCTITVPPSLTDTCDYNGPEPLRNGISVWIITLPHTNDDN